LVRLGLDIANDHLRVREALLGIVDEASTGALQLFSCRLSGRTGKPIQRIGETAQKDRSIDEPLDGMHPAPHDTGGIANQPSRVAAHRVRHWAAIQPAPALSIARQGGRLYGGRPSRRRAGSADSTRVRRRRLCSGLGRRFPRSDDIGAVPHDLALSLQDKVGSCADCPAVGVARRCLSLLAEMLDLSAPAIHEFRHRLAQAASRRLMSRHANPSALSIGFSR